MLLYILPHLSHNRLSIYVVVVIVLLLALIRCMCIGCYARLSFVYCRSGSDLLHDQPLSVYSR